MSYRGTLEVDAVFGPLSNTVSETTTTPPPSGTPTVDATPTTVNLNALNATAALSAVAKDASGATVSSPVFTWKSLNTAIVTVSAAGVLTAKGVGTTSVTVSAASGGADTVAVTVTQKATTVSIAPGAATIAPGATQKFTATVKDANGFEIPGAAVAWSVGDPTVASVSGTGLATALKAGMSTVRATSGGQTSAAVLTVESATPPPPPSGDFHEPAGMTQIFSMDGTSKNWGPQWRYGSKWGDPTEGSAGPFTERVSVVSDSKAPNGKAVQVQWKIGDGDGFGGAAFWDWEDDIGLQKELYIRATFMYSSNWQQHSSNTTKIFYYGAGSRGGTTQFYPQMNADPGKLRWRDQSGDGDDGVFTPTSGGGISVGVYHTLEIYQVAQSRVGAKDGRVRVWLDGVEITDWKWLGTTDGGTDLTKAAWNFIGQGTHPYFRGIQLGTFWGGSGDTKHVNDYMRWGSFYISGKPVS